MGRVTRRPHTVEMWFGVADGSVYALSGGRDRSDWVRNLIATPEVTLQVGDSSVAATARVVDPGTDEDAMARRLLAGKYQGWNEGKVLSEWARTALPIAIIPL